MAFASAAIVAPCCAASRVVAPSLQSLRIVARQQSFLAERRTICHRAMVRGRSSRPLLCSKQAPPQGLHAQHGLSTRKSASSKPSAERQLAAGWMAASVSLLPLLLQALQPGSAFADEAVTTLQQVVSEGDRALAAGDELLSSAAEALAPGTSGGMSLTDTVTSVLFVLAVIALLVLTLGVAYLTLTSFLDERREKEDLKTLKEAKPNSASAAKPAGGKAAKKRPVSASRGGGKGFGGPREF